VKAHGAEPYERKRFNERLDAFVRDSMGALSVAALSHPVSETLGSVVIVVLLVVGSQGAWGIRPELFIAFLAVSLRLMPPVKAISQFPAVAEGSLVAADRIFEILDHPGDDVDPPGTETFPGLRDRIVFEDVWFAYEPGTWVLQGARLEVPRGRVVAIVGPSGAGKSTLVDMLPRFIDPQRGAVLLDGVPSTRYGRKSVRRQLGIVSQHTVIFNDTVRANIAYGDEAGASLESVEAAARASRAGSASASRSPAPSCGTRRS
jgi:subfamily B ATP-binding cassette protein MsbA